MGPKKPALLVTGVSGNLGRRLLPLLDDFHVIGLDIAAPREIETSFEFEQIDLGQEPSCGRMAAMLRQTHAVGVVHLAFVLDPLQTGILDRDRMWRINVAGTARVVEAIAEANRMGAKVGKLLHLSSVSVYGPNLKRPVRENDELKAHTLAYAVHKKESELAVQARVQSLGGCDVYILRPHIFAGATVSNYMIDCIRGTAYGPGRVGRMLARRKSKLPIILPMGKEFLEHKLQFAHVDDVARVIAWLLARGKESDQLTILNVASRGDSLTVAQCAEIIGTPVRRLPTVIMCRALVNTMWSMGATSIPPDSFPYLIGSYTLDISKLHVLLADSYEKVIRYTNESALIDSRVGSSNEVGLSQSQVKAG